MLFTGVLAGVGGTQGYLLLRQIRLARDEFNATHRPRIRVRRIAFDGFGEKDVGVAFVSVVNIGEGRATVTGVAGGFFLRARDGRWPKGRPDFDSFGVPPKPVLIAGQLETWMAADKKAFAPDDLALVAAGAWQLWIIGEIRYRDDANITRQTGFAWCCDKDSKEFFVQKAEESYNYED